MQFFWIIWSIQQEKKARKNLIQQFYRRAVEIHIIELEALAAT